MISLYLFTINYAKWHLKHKQMDNLNSDALKQTQSTADALSKSLGDLDRILDQLKDSQKEFTDSFKECAKALKESSDNFEKLEEQIKKVNLQFDKNAAILNNSNGSLAQNKAVLNSLLEQYENLTKEQGDNAKGVKDLNNQIGQLSATIHSQEKKLADSRKVFDFHKAGTDALKSSIESLKGSAGTFGPVLEDVSKGFNGLKQGSELVKTGFQSIGGAIKATGFGLLMLVLQSVTEYLTKTTAGQKLLQGSLSAIGKAIEIVKGALIPLGGVIVNALLHPVDSIKSIWNSLIQNLTNRFKAFGVILDGIMHLNIKRIGDGLIQSFTGVTNATDKMGTALKKTKEFISESSKEIVKAYGDGVKAAVKNKETHAENHKQLTAIHQERIKQVNEARNITREAEAERIASISRMSQKVLEGYAKEVSDTQSHFKQLEEQYKKHKTTVEQLEKERIQTLININAKFETDDLKKLDAYEKELQKIAQQASMSAKDLAIEQLQDEFNAKATELDKEAEDAKKRRRELEKLKKAARGEQLQQLEVALDKENQIITKAAQVRSQLEQKLIVDKAKTGNEFDQKDKQDDINKAEQSGNHTKALQLQKQLLDMQYKAEIANAKKTGKDVSEIEAEFAKKKAALEDQLAASKIHAGDKYINAILQNTKKESAIYKAAFLAKKATSVADTIISTRRAVLDSLKAYSDIPFIGQALGIAQAAFMAAQGAMSIAEISKQKPGFASGGQFISDGRGAVLPGYSRTDNTNAYLRSGEAVVVSEAMRNPWARNLVSAVNVAFGGRDFSVTNPGRGYAIGGIFTDGGNANRYYSQPMNDVKDLANTLAYQMINNFPPVYVDVKDINNQQNILAQTVNRVNL